MMKFWDTSAIIPLIIDQACSSEIKEIFKPDTRMVVFWGTYIECHSALSRLHRENILTREGLRDAIKLLDVLNNYWTEILPGNLLKEQSVRVISIHGLKTLDSLQLASALIWTNKNPKGNGFVSLDRQLREAAGREGFNVLPEKLCDV
jgi:predicted nucleic acid-binding protein